MVAGKNVEGNSGLGIAPQVIVRGSSTVAAVVYTGVLTMNARYSASITKLPYVAGESGNEAS